MSTLPESPGAQPRPPVLVLGATGDLGSAVARRLRADGTPAILHGYSRTTELAYLADETGAAARVAADLTTDDGVGALGETLAGFDMLSGLINCTGVNPSPDRVTEIATSEWQAALDLNLTSVWRTASLALPKLRGARSGAIVLVSSVFGIRTPSRRAAYGASKHALTGLAQAIAQEEEGIVRANVVAPGPMWSESSRQVFVKHARKEGVTVDQYISYRAARIPGHRFVTADAVAKVCVFLTSDGAGAINGQCIVADGGEY
ncbi:SDR family NAD(P)-dependent oxidoreductase [Nocardioides albus]|uniref:NAD(P)-dependent dehydrogenase (Short-subunit alcohol dehydrogenase family) n=1 Tax=Nocardioides albus TaxID=1841 RepID=A0A7W5FBI6_9ACTN|nr:SDR family oxidoreductase [Nocardioides albus]MBB3092262.1 NAD(P)-dependent dehydrogenase (short-subunit alcohol dehydrogenase family) [Nocardioides albus]GGU11617.1 short-chain dehydrogenase [Nocardioides albus]